jgi:hypothetical protein
VLSKWWPVMEGVVRGMAPSDEGEMKAMRCRFSSAIHARRRAVVDGTAASAKLGSGSGVRRWKMPLSWAKLLGRKVMIGPAGMIG